MSIKHYQESKPVYSKNTFPLLYIAVFVALIYAIALVVRSVRDGVEQTRILSEEQAKINQAKLKVEIARRFIEYQQTPSYIEKQARQHFAFIKPGEKMVSVPQNSDKSQELADEQAGREALVQERVASPHPQQWYEYFFGK